MISWTIEAYYSNGDYAYYEGTNQENNAFVQYTEDRTIITETIPLNVGVEYTLTVQDSTGYSSSQFYSVSPGRANFALSGSKYGASFGCLPKGTEENPMLESAYPIYAYGGIEGVTNYVEGEVNTGGRWIDGKPVYRNLSVFKSITANKATNGTITVANFADLNIEALVDMRVIVDRGNWFVNTFYLNNEWTWSTRLDDEYTLAIRYNSPQAETINEIIVILEYTKTTD